MSLKTYTLCLLLTLPILIVLVYYILLLKVKEVPHCFNSPNVINIILKPHDILISYL